MAKKKQQYNNNPSKQEDQFKRIRIDDLATFDPLTDNQTKAFNHYDNDKCLLLHGVAGTGKTFIAIYKALEEVLDPSSSYKKLVIVRSAVATRDIGFLKGDDKDKIAVYEAPYISLCEELFGISTAYEALKAQGSIEFIPTSFIRGVTINNAIVVVDECENLNFHELDSVMTRPGENTKIIYSGDYRQSDFKIKNEKDGILDFMKILKAMSRFKFVEFGIDDIVRSDLVKEYIITKMKIEEEAYGL